MGSTGSRGCAPPIPARLSLLRARQQPANRAWAEEYGAKAAGDRWNGLRIGLSHATRRPEFRENVSKIRHLRRLFGLHGTLRLGGDEAIVHPARSRATPRLGASTPTSTIAHGARAP